MNRCLWAGVGHWLLLAGLVQPLAPRCLGRCQMGRPPAAAGRRQTRRHYRACRTAALLTLLAGGSLLGSPASARNWQLPTACSAAPPAARLRPQPASGSKLIGNPCELDTAPMCRVPEAAEPAAQQGAACPAEPPPAAAAAGAAPSGGPDGGGSTSPACYKALGNEEFRNGRFLKAAALFTQGIKQDPESAALYRWGGAARCSRPGGAGHTWGRAPD